MAIIYNMHVQQVISKLRFKKKMQKCWKRIVSIGVFLHEVFYDVN